MAYHIADPAVSSLSDEIFNAYNQSRHPSINDKHMKSCWKHSSCGKCLKSNNSCGWCPSSATCVPLPEHGHLLSPISDKHICPLPREERWDLRTSTFGCNCSTTTFLAAIITCVSTLVGLFLLIGLFKLIKYTFLAFRGTKGGWEIQEETAEIRRNERIWVRKQPGWGAWIKSFWKKTPEDEVLVVGEYTPLVQ